MKAAIPLLPRIAAVLVFAWVGEASHADIYTVRRQGASIVPERSEDISMEGEDVILQRHQYGFNVIATFVIRNHSDKQIDSVVAFPISGSSYMSYLDINREFKVEVKSGGGPESDFIPVQAQVKPGQKRKARDDYFAGDPPKTVGVFPESVVWNVSWSARETKTIRVNFDMGEPMVVPGSNQIASGWQAMYIVSTGALWKGPIGRADISIRFTSAELYLRSRPGALRLVSYPDHATWNGSESVSWHFENWTPTNEIWIRSLDWHGLAPEAIDDYFFTLPVDYQGGKSSYSEALIDSLVERDLTLARQYFPEKVAAFDRAPLKIAIADWLLHEIYARHGDPFFVGKESPTLKIGDGRFGDTKGNLYSEWQEKFRGYTYKGRWYRPNYSPRGVVKTAALLPMERENVAFLRAYLTKLREDPNYLRQRNPIHTPGSERLAHDKQ